MFAYIAEACPICRRFERHAAVLALCRALLRAGSRMEISRAIMPMTTSNSTSVKARGRRARLRLRSDMMQFLLVGGTKCRVGDFLRLGRGMSRGWRRFAPIPKAGLEKDLPIL